MSFIVESIFFKTIAKNFKNLEFHLQQARMDVNDEQFVQRCLMTATYLSIFISVILYFFLKGESLVLILVFFPILYILLFFYFMRLPEVRFLKNRNKVEAEIVSSIRFLILEMKAGRSMYDSLVNIGRNFSEVGKYTDEIINKIVLGKTMDQAIEEAVELVPSENLRSVLWQLLNHTQTGSDVTAALKTIVDDVVEKQKIEFKKYGKKLNALSLFYMIIAIILPTIGFTIVAAALMFIGFKMTYLTIILVWMLFTLLQVMFVVISVSNRPPIDM